VVISCPGALLRGKKPRYLLNRRLRGPRANIDTEGKRKTSLPSRDLMYESSVFQSIAYSLYCLDFFSMLDKVFTPARLLGIQRLVCRERMV
jgi:hypothetical protein